MLTLSLERKPLHLPLAYCRRNVSPISDHVDDSEWSYLECGAQPSSSHEAPVTQKLDEPVSKSSWNVWPGEPMLTSP